MCGGGPVAFPGADGPGLLGCQVLALRELWGLSLSCATGACPSLPVLPLCRRGHGKQSGSPKAAIAYQLREGS